MKCTTITEHEVHNHEQFGSIKVSQSCTFWWNKNNYECHTQHMTQDILGFYAIMDSMAWLCFKLFCDFTQPRSEQGIPIFTVGYPNLREYANSGIPKFTGCVNFYDTGQCHVLPRYCTHYELGLDLHGHTVPTSKRESTASSRHQTIVSRVIKKSDIWMPFLRVTFSN